MKKILLICLVFISFWGFKAKAQTMGIYESYVIINNNGGGNTFYDLTAATANPDFSGANLGTFNQTQTLVLAGAQNKTFKCSGGNVTGGNTYYRIWLQGNSAPAYTTLSPAMGFVSNDAGGCGGNQTWQTNTATVNLLQGLGVGTYNVEVYTDATGTPSTATTASFTATFTVNSVFGDNFNRATLSPGGSPSMTYTSTLATGATATLNGSAFLDIVNSTTAGVSYVTGSTSTFASPYATTLSSNTGVVTWTFNMRYNRTSDPSGFAASNYGSAIVLAGTNSNIATSGNGYAVVYGNSGTTDPIRLVAYTTGLAGTLTNICTSSANDIASVNNYASVRVTYDPTTNTWALYVRDDGASAWADPISGVTSQKGSNTVNSTYTGSALTTFGFFWNHAGTASQSSQFDRFNVQVASSTTPTLSTPTATVTSSTAVTLGATVTSNGGSSLTARGTAYKTTAGVAATDNPLAEGGTTVSSFTHSRTGLSPQTQYFYVGYATNTVPNTGISTESSFRTWSNPPTAQPTSFSIAPPTASSQLTANWTNATFPVSGATQGGYLVIYSTSTPTLSSANGNAPAAGVGTLVNITPTNLPTTPAVTTTISGLTNGTLYNFLLIPYTWDGTNAATYNYLTASALTTTGTPAAQSYTWSGGTSGAWSTPANWTPATSAAGPTTGDAVTFNTGGAITITSVPSVTLGSFTVSTSGTAVSLTPLSGATSRTITLSNAGTALSIASGTTVNITGTLTTPTTLGFAFSGSGNTATIAGTLNLNNGGTGATGFYTATNSTTTVSGILSRNSNCTVTSTGSNLTFSGTGTFQLKGGAASAPTATWNAGSTLEFNQTVTAATTITNVAQSFSNVTINANMTSPGTLDFAGAMTSIGGNLTVTTTGTGTFYFNSSTTNITATVGGNIVISGGTTDLGFGTGNTTINLTGNFTNNSTGLLYSTGSTLNSKINFAGTTQSITGGSSGGMRYVDFTINSGSTTSLATNFELTNTTTSSFPSTLTVNSGGTLNCAAFNITNNLTGNAGKFVNNGTLRIGSANGITAGVTQSGNIQVTFATSGRTYSASGNYTYDGTVNQVTGNGLPASLTGILKIDNTGAVNNNIVTLSQATSTSGTLSLTNGSLDLNALILTLSSNAAQSITGNGSNTFNITGAANSTLALSAPTTSHVVTLSNFGTGTSANLITGANVNVQLNSNTQLDCAGNGTTTSMLTVLGTFTLNSATASNIANVHPPFYGSSSTLVYNVSYGRFSEWSTTSGPGYPNNVTVSNNSTLDVVNSVNSYKRAAGNLTVNSGSTFSIPALTTGNGSGVGVEFLGNIINDGTISLNTGANTTNQRLKAVNLTNGNSNSTAIVNLSGASGGDLELTGNFTDNAVFNANARAVFFTGTGTQVVSGTASAPFNIDYIVSSKASGIIQLGVDLLTEGPNGGNAITLTNATDIIDLNGKIFTIGKALVNSVISGNGLIRGSSTSSLIVNGTGAFGTIRFDQTGSGNVLQNFTLNRTTTGSVTLGNNLTVAGTLAFADGTLTVGANTLTISGSSPTRTSGYIDATNASATVAFTNTSAISLPAGIFNNNINNLTINGSGGVTLGANLNVAGTLATTSGILTVGANTLTISGSSPTRTSGYIDATNAGATVAFTNTSAISLPAGIFNNNINNLTINGSGGVTLGANLNVAGTLATTSGILTVGANTLTISGSSPTRTSGYIDATNASATVAFTNTGAITLPAGLFTGNISTCTINGAGGVTLGSATGIATALNLTSGTLTNSTFLTVANGATITRSAGSLSAAPIYGSSGTDRVNITITGTCTAGNELAGTTGGIGTLTVNNNAVYTLNADRTLDALSVASGATIDGATYVLTPRATGTVSIAGTFKTANLLGFSGSAAAAISSTNTPTITLTGSTIEYNAASASQVITARTDYNNLTISGGFAKSINGSTTIGGVLSLASSSDILSLGTNTISLTGTVTGSGFIRGSSTSSLSIGGTGALGTLNFDQSSDGTTNVLNNITVNRSSGTLSLGNKLVITNTYTPTAGTLTTNGNLHIRSTSSNTALIAQGSSSGGYISGDVTVERYMSANSNRAWRLITPGVTTTTNINANWQEGVNNTAVNTNVPSATAGYGTHITGSGGSSNGFDVTQNNAASLYDWNQSAQDWTIITNTNVNTLDAKKGYLLFVRGNRDNINTINTTTGSSNVTLRAKGTLAQGDQTFTGLATAGNFSLVTNPFAAPVNWVNMYTGANAANFNSSVTIWDPNINTRGGFVTVNNSGTNSNGSSLITANIQSGQAFFIQTQTGVSGNPSFTILESNKSATNNLDVFRTGTQTEKLSIQLKYTANNIDRTADGVVAVFNNNYSSAVDGNDAEQIANWDEDIALLRNGKELSIEARPLADNNDTLYLQTNRLRTAQSTYRWEITPQNIQAAGMEAYLKDNFTNTTTPVSLTANTVINFTVNSNAASTAANRFSIVFKNNAALPVTVTQLKAYQKNNTINVDWTTVQEQNIAAYEVEKSNDAQQFTKLTTVQTKGNNNNTTNNYTAVDVTTQTGHHYYRIKVVEKNGSYSYTQVVRVTIDATGNGQIIVYPNPIKNSSMNVQLQNMEKGKYILQLISQTGQLVQEEQLEHNGGSGSQTIMLSKHISSGIYQLKLIDVKGKVYQQKIVKE